MYYLAGNTLWRGTSIPFAPNWSSLSNVTIPFGYLFSALGTGILHGNDTPTSVLYLAASSNNQSPRLFRLDNASESRDGPIEISIAALPEGAYIHNIAVNPQDGSELLVVASNYNIIGLYHSTDAGITFSAVEGNLTGTMDNPGPSLRSATILPIAAETKYLIGTSTGVYSASSLQGANTTWSLEGEATIGNTIIESLTSRPSDGRVAVATHGRGIFIGSLQSPVSIEGPTLNDSPLYSLEQNYPNPFTSATTLRYSLRAASRINLEVFDVAGRSVEKLIQDKEQGPGTYSIDFNSGTLSSGMYIYELEITSLHSNEPVQTASRTMVLSK